MVKFDLNSMLKSKKESNFSLVQLVFVHYPSILTNFLRVTEHFSDQNRALRLSILAGKQKSTNVPKPTNFEFWSDKFKTLPFAKGKALGMRLEERKKERNERETIAWAEKVKVINPVISQCMRLELTWVLTYAQSKE